MKCARPVECENYSMGSLFHRDQTNETNETDEINEIIERIEQRPLSFFHRRGGGTNSKFERARGDEVRRKREKNNFRR